MNEGGRSAERSAYELAARFVIMSPAEDSMLNEIRRAIDRLKAAGTRCTDANIAAELGITATEYHAVMRQLFSEGRRIEPDDPSTW